MLQGIKNLFSHPEKNISCSRAERTEKVNPNSSNPITKVKVAVRKGEDKHRLLDEVILKSGFLKDLEKKFAESGKSKADFLIALKPNLMMFTHKENPPATYTDPELIEHLIKRIRERGFRNLKLVESQNLYGNWYKNRDVKTVARAAGFSGDGYDIVDMTEEKIPYDYGCDSMLKKHFIGKTWKDADYRISFAKNKTHATNVYTLALKNIYGCTPMQDKALEYHALREWDKSALDILKHFPVDFGFVDAFWSADGILGWKGTKEPKHTKIIYGGKDLRAVDIVGGRMMGTNSEESSLTKLALNAFGKVEIDLDSNLAPNYVHEGWSFLNLELLPKIEIPDVVDKCALVKLIREKSPKLIQNFLDSIEESYGGFNIMGLVTNGLSGDEMDKNTFPLKGWKEIADHIKHGIEKNVENLVKNPEARKQLLEDIKGLFS